MSKKEKLFVKIVGTLEELKELYSEVEDSRSQRFIELKIKEIYHTALINEKEKLAEISYEIYHDLDNKNSYTCELAIN